MLPNKDSLRRAPECSGSSEPEAHDQATDVAARLGQTLRRVRLRRGLSLDRLARASGVSRSMLGQIEQGQSSPSVTIAWKIAGALGVPLGALLSTGEPTVTVERASEARFLVSSDGSCRRRDLHGESGEEFGFYELRLAVGAEERWGDAAGTSVRALVQKGEVDVAGVGRTYRLGTGDAFRIEGEPEVLLRNVGRNEAVLYVAKFPPAPCRADVRYNV